MPELPEVETIVRDLRPHLVGLRIRAVEVLHHRVVRYSNHPLPDVLPGTRIFEVQRHGKFILVRLDNGWLTIHLGMTGQLVWDGAAGLHTRVIFTLDGGTLLYNDIRMFGAIEWSAEPRRTAQLGADALGASLDISQLHARKGPIKAVLLNQAIFSGIGNIYADEALFRAGIHPRRRTSRISPERIQLLVRVIQELLQEAVAHRGSSVSDYVDGSGARGSFQEFHQVYGREGLPCVRCGCAIRRIVVAQRGTHYCPKCQR